MGVCLPSRHTIWDVILAHLEDKQEGEGEGSSYKNDLEKISRDPLVIHLSRWGPMHFFQLGRLMVLLARRTLEQGARSFNSYQPIMRSCVV
jgi:hypothetical protein